jgi:hypothetical protein
MRLLRLEVARGPDAIQVWAKPAEGEGQRLEIDGTRPGSRTEWQGLSVETAEFLPRAVAAMYVEDAPGFASSPAARLKLTAPGRPGDELVVYAGAGPSEFRGGLAIEYEMHDQAAEAEQACRAERPGQPDRLAILAPDGRVRDEVLLPAGRRKVGSEFVLKNLGVRMKVGRYFPRAVIDPTGAVVEAPPTVQAPAAVELVPLATQVPAFWVLATGSSEPAESSRPAELQGLQVIFNPSPRPSDMVLVSGPPGKLQLVVLDDGRPTSVRPVAAGGEVELPAFGSLRLKVAEILQAARVAYRPGKDGDGPSGPACRLVVADAGGQRKEFWLFPGISGTGLAFGTALDVRLVRGTPRRLAAVVEIADDKKGTSELRSVESGRPLRYRGYQVALAAVSGEGEESGRLIGMAQFSVVRDPGLWAFYAGLILAAVGAPWLLWTRFRRVSDSDTVVMVRPEAPP